MSFKSRRGATNSPLKSKINASTMISKTLSLNVYCSRSEDLEPWTVSTEKDVFVSNIANGNYAKDIRCNFIEYKWHGNDKRNNEINALYFRYLVAGLSNQQARELIVSSCLDMPTGYPKRLIHCTVNGKPNRLTIDELLRTSQKTEILFSYEPYFSVNRYAETFVLSIPKARFKELNDYFSNPNRTIKAVFIDNDFSENFRILVIPQFLMSETEYFNYTNEYAKLWRCTVDICLKLESYDKWSVPSQVANKMERA